MSKRVVMLLLNEMEMVGECGVDMMEGDVLGQESAEISMQEVLKILPEEIMPSVHNMEMV
jgi:hypothetical protein